MFHYAFYLILLTLILSVTLFSSQEVGASPRTFGGFTLMTILTNSMYPELGVSDLVVLREIDTDEIEIGDIITHVRAQNTTVTHRVVDIIENYNGTGERGFRLRGDNNMVDDTMTVMPEQIVGRIIYSNAPIGQVITFIQSYILEIIVITVTATASWIVIKKFIIGKSIDEEGMEDLTQT